MTAADVFVGNAIALCYNARCYIWFSANVYWTAAYRTTVLYRITARSSVKKKNYFFLTLENKKKRSKPLRLRRYDNNNNRTHTITVARFAGGYACDNRASHETTFL